MQMRGADHFRAPASFITDIWQLPWKKAIHPSDASQGRTLEIVTYLALNISSFVNLCSAIKTLAVLLPQKMAGQQFCLLLHDSHLHF